MLQATGHHPLERTLFAYAQGRLTEAETVAVARHVESCPECQEVANNAPSDSLVRRLRAAQARRSWTHLPVGSTRGPVPAAPVDPSELPDGLRDHAKYKVLRVLGQGGMGVVYLAQHAMMDRLVAIKVINHALVGQGDALERFQREVKAAARLDHPNIVRAYDSEESGGLHILVMEYVEGRSLADVVTANGSLPVTRACHYIRQAAKGLQHAHERGMLHRDLKPSNLMLTAKGEVKILDFGLAKLAGEQRSQAGITQDDMALGTPEYMAPEQAIDTRTADIRADIYSLGCTLYYLLTGRPPFPIDDGGGVMPVLVAHLEDAPPRLTETRPEAPAELADALERMVAKDPTQRPQTPRDVVEALRPFAAPSRADSVAVRHAGALQPSGHGAPPDPRRKRIQARRFTVGAAVTAGLLAVAGIAAVPAFMSTESTSVDSIPVPPRIPARGDPPQPRFRVTASHCFVKDRPDAVCDGFEPKNSRDGTIDRFTWWPRQGTAEWLQYECAKPFTAEGVGVYWYIDSPPRGCRAPASWRLLYRDGAAWKPVENASAYGTAADRFNDVTFQPVTTTALRIEVRLCPDRSAGVLEWTVVTAARFPHPETGGHAGREER